MTRSRLNRGDGDAHRVLGPSLVNFRQKATIGPLHPTYGQTAPFSNYMRMEPNMFDEILNRVGLETKRVTPTAGKRLNQA